MRFITGVLFTILAGQSMAMPSISSPRDVTKFQSHAPHSANGAAVFNPDPDSTKVVSQVCIEFSFDNGNWWYTKQNPWGSGSGTFGSLPNKKMCLPTNNGAGGALFIGPNPNPGPGSTKLECFFPTSGTANCDISLVDGYSLSLICAPSSSTGSFIGGTVDLWTEGNSCPDKQGPNCINQNGYAPNQGDVNKFFQPAVQNQDYCIWVNCAQDYYFPVTDTLNCYVTGTAK